MTLIKVPNKTDFIEAKEIKRVFSYNNNKHVDNENYVAIILKDGTRIDCLIGSQTEAEHHAMKIVLEVNRS